MVAIRTSKYEDFDALTDLMANFHIEENKCNILRGDPQKTRTILTGIIVGVESNGFEVFVAEESKNLVGYLLVNKINPSYPNSLVLEEIYVKPQYRGEGIAKKLNQRAFLYAVGCKIYNIYTEIREINAANLRVNEKLGFEYIKRERRENSYYLVLKKTIGDKLKEDKRPINL